MHLILWLCFFCSLGNPAKSTLTLPEPLTHTGRPIVVGLKALVASPLGAALIATVGVGADRPVRRADRGELGALVFV